MPVTQAIVAVQRWWMIDELIRASVSEDGGAVCRPVFSNDAVYTRELNRIFARKWIYLGHESQLKAPGDFVSAYIGETPVIVARAKSGEIVASINSCTHRGLPVCRSDKGHAARFTCPYHNWVYSVEGDLIGVPQDRLFETKVDRDRAGSSACRASRASSA